MITEELKDTVDKLSKDEKKELSKYLLQSRLENDPEYIARVSSRLEDYKNGKGKYVDLDTVR